MKKGEVKFFDSEKGEGLIIDKRGAEIPVKYSGLHSKYIKAGDKVTFDLAEDSKMQQAVNVTKA
ncbi:MAG: cold-shock protein [Pedobacter sp.]|nr:MAG: cold-shock protein [Pedobacter sp.]